MDELISLFLLDKCELLALSNTLSFELSDVLEPVLESFLTINSWIKLMPFLLFGVLFILFRFACASSFILWFESRLEALDTFANSSSASSLAVESELSESSESLDDFCFKTDSALDEARLTN